MSVTSSINYKEYAANGIATTFAIPFLLLNDKDLEVYLDNRLITTGYMLNGVTNPISEIVFYEPPNGRLCLQRTVILLRETDYQENGDLLARTLNQDFDRLYLALQGTAQNNNKTIRVADPEGIPSLPFAEERINKLLSFDSKGQPLLVNIASGSAMELAQNLADSKGAGMLGYDKTLDYPKNTVGAQLQSIPKITISTENPNDAIGNDGEIWLQVEP